ncbi:MAG TPA: Ku protein [Rhabdochlamydiaceae bacterium]|nr:Ku protein [Rhabdochlamydiaceae bacterium]
MRSIWKGAISFGLIHIPVRLYSACKERELKFKLLHKKDLSEIRYARICKADGKEVPWEEVVKGYEYRKGDYVVLTEDDFEKASPKRMKTIEIVDFTGEEEIDPMFYETPYYLEPEKGSSKAYQILREALRRSKKVAIGKYVLRQHEHLGVIKAHGDILVLNQLRYNSEILSSKGLDIPKDGPLVKSEVDMALLLIEELSKPFRASHYSDTYSDEVKRVIASRARGKKIKREKSKAPKVHDLMGLLKESLEQHKKKGRRKAA